MKNENTNRKLDQMNRSGEFKVPNGFFEKMLSDIEAKSKIDELKKSSESKIVPMKRSIPKAIYYIAVAASLLIGVILYNNNVPVEEECLTFACLLENTEITPSDIEYLEQDDYTDFLDDDYNDEFLN